MGTETSSLSLYEIILFLSWLVTFVYCYIFCYIKGKSRKRKFKERMKEQGNVVIGKKIKAKLLRGDMSAKSESGRSNTWVVTYGYVVNGVEYKRKVRFDGGLGLPKANYPVQVNVCYDPRRPKKAVLEEEVPRMNHEGCLITVFLPLVVGHLMSRLLSWLS